MKPASTFLAFVVLVLLAAWSTSCSPRKEEKAAVDTTYRVTVTLSDLDSGRMLMSYREGDQWKRDSAQGVHGQYEFTGKTPVTRKAYLNVLGERGRTLALYLENGKITVTTKKDSLDKVVATGTPTNNDNASLQQQKAAVNARFSAVTDAYRAADKSNQALLDSLDKAYEDVEKSNRTTTLAFIKEHPSSLVSAFEIYELYIYNPDVAEFEGAYNLLDSSVRVSTIGQEVSRQLDIAKRTDINQLAPDFTLNDTNDKPVMLSSLRGKYLLIDFWASWCGPCRRENPRLVKAYQAYNKKGFEIVGVSLDNPGDRDKWLEAIKKDKLAWLQLSDLKGWECAVAKQYGIQAIPMNFLLDPEGRIVAKGLNGEQLSAKLATLLAAASSN